MLQRDGPCGSLCFITSIGTAKRSGGRPVHSSLASPDLTVLGIDTRSPLRGPGLFAKIAPFAAVASLAEVSLLLPPGVASVQAAYASAVLLALTAVAFLLPWARLPRNAAVMVPLAYCGAALSLSFAAGRSSGIGMVVFLPVVWTALFHDKWESVCLVAAVALIELILSVSQDATDATAFRRLGVLTLLAVVISVGIHILRDRVRQAHRQVETLKDELQAVELADERLRIALSLQEEVVTQIFTATLALRRAQSSGGDRRTNQQIDTVIDDLDETVRRLRLAVFDVHTRPGRAAPRPIEDRDMRPAAGETG